MTARIISINANSLTGWTKIYMHCTVQPWWCKWVVSSHESYKAGSGWMWLLYRHWSSCQEPSHSHSMCELQNSQDQYNISRSFLILIQISYASSSSVLNDRSVYPTLFRTVPSDEALAPALATLMNYYGWRKVAILTEKKPQFEKVITFTIYFHIFFVYYLNKMYSMSYSVAYSFYSYSTVLWQQPTFHSRTNM